MSNIKFLLETIDRLDEDPAEAGVSTAPVTAQANTPSTDLPPADAQRADQFKAEQNHLAAKQLMQSVKSKNDLGMVNGNYIEAETGILRHKMIANTDATYIRPDEVNNPDIKQFVDKLTAVGVPPTPTKLEAGRFQISGQWQNVLKIDIDKLKKVASAPQYPGANTSTNTNTNTNTNNTGTADKLTGNPEVQKKIDRIKEIIGLGKTNAGANTTGAANMGQVNNESIFKSSIGKALLESFDLDLNEDTGTTTAFKNPREELDSLWSELQNGVKSGIITGPQATQIDQLMSAVTQYRIQNPANTGTTTGTDTGNNTGTADKKKEPYKIPGDDIIQDYIIKHGGKDDDGKVPTRDGYFGWRTQEAKRNMIDNWYKTLPKEKADALTKEYNDLVDKAVPAWAKMTIVPDKRTGATARPGASKTRSINAADATPSPNGTGNKVNDAPQKVPKVDNGTPQLQFSTNNPPTIEQLTIALKTLKTQLSDPGKSEIQKTQIQHAIDGVQQKMAELQANPNSGKPGYDEAGKPLVPQSQTSLRQPLQPTVKTESVGYSEDPTLARIVQLAR
jgi:hypothetical protein